MITQLIGIEGREPEYALKWISLNQPLPSCTSGWVVSFYVFKWTRDYSPKSESPIFPVWVTLDMLPLHLIDYQALFSIATLLGRPVKVDDYTINRDRREGARICIEMDISEPAPTKLHIRMGGKDIYTNCKYEEKPSYCQKCQSMGHAETQHSHQQVAQPTGKVPSGKGPGGSCKETEASWQMVKRKKTNGKQKVQLHKKLVEYGPKKFEWKIKFSEPQFNKFAPLNLMDLSVNQLGTNTKNHLPCCELETTIRQLLDLQPLTNNEHSGNSLSSFPSLKEAKEYINKSEAQTKEKLQEATIEKKTKSNGDTCRFSLDDCLYNHSPEKGLAMLVDELQLPSQTEDEETLKEIGRHSDDDDTEDVIDSSELKPQHFKIPAKNATPISAPRKKKSKKEVDASQIGDDFSLYNMKEDTQWVNCDLIDTSTKESYRVTTVYGKHKGAERRDLWAGLVNLIPSCKWIVGGDFNITTACSEHSGRNIPRHIDMEEFKDCLDSCGLVTPHTVGSVFTWSGNRSNGRVMRRLDRALVNNFMMEDFEDICIKHLSKTSSDHKPVLLICSKAPLGGPKPFRFLDAWLNHPTFLKMVSNYWDKTSNHGGMAGLVMKLKGLKGQMKEWNSNTFGNIINKLKEAEQATIQAQENYEREPSSENREQENKTKAQLIVATNNELNFWKQKANRKDVSMDPVLDHLEVTITEHDNTKLSKIPTPEEIKEQACWHIIKEDVISATQEFFIGIPIPKSYGSTFLTLIPKTDNPTSFGEYRPISLSSFMSKINTRILADRLQNLLPKFISSEQTGFQRGMGVDEQILLVEEMVHKIDSKIRGGNVILKLDMAKAFDNMEWSYIQGVLNKLGFSDHNQKLLMANLKDTFISIMINGSP
ncbi:unnamed protein product [Cuscuta campestris]|uniref:Reverse transcriptase domain-containing protein n=1 Tax=Cuscuta campestris TaxID=132261 RepID=A0A484MZP9_9ASTE|nr:unnamed protein product [Cuscuta campestris]